MNDEFKQVRLGDVCSVKSSKRVFAKEYVPSGVPFFRSKDVIDKCLGTFENYDLFITRERFMELKALTGAPSDGDILLSAVGNRCGRAYLVDGDGDFYFKDGNIIWISDFSETSSSYLKSFINSKKGQSLLESVMIGSAQKALTIDSIRNLFVPFPAHKEQQAIANILDTLDDKIELNRKTNETLEGIAKALFKSWFLDFDPVRAMAEGRPTGLPDEISDLFPDSFEDSELGEIPSGWSVQRLEDLLELSYGKALKETDRIPGPFPVYGSNGEVGFHNEALVRGPGIIVGRKGNPGIVKWSEKDFFPIDTSFYVKPKKDALKLTFLFYALSNQRLPELSADSAVPGLNRNIAYMNQQVLPPLDFILVFDQMVSTIFDRMSCLSSEKATLSSLRDALLPRLISGELRVPDAEKMLEEVGV